MKDKTKDNYGKPRQEYYDSIKAMDDERLYEETTHKIWLSAYANNNPRSDFHWHVSAIYDEWVSRGKVDQYEKAYDQIVKENQ